MHIGGASAISWSMVFVSIFALLPCGLVLQARKRRTHGLTPKHGLTTRGLPLYRRGPRSLEDCVSARLS